MAHKKITPAPHRTTTHLYHQYMLVCAGGVLALGRVEGTGLSLYHQYMRVCAGGVLALEGTVQPKPVNSIRKVRRRAFINTNGTGQ